MKTNKIMAIVAAVTISAGGVAFIAQKEGKENDPYKDIAGVWTVCYGSTGAHVVPGHRVEDEECLSLLDEDLDRFEAAVNRCTPAPKNQNQFDAMVSLSFNIGERAYCNSTFARKFNAGDAQGAADQFLVWNKATINGVRVSVRGLTNRRVAERTLFLTPPVGSPPVAPVAPGTNCPSAPVAVPTGPGNRG